MTQTRPSWPEHADVLVVGGGNAGLCAAITAAEQGARVLVIEKAEKAYRGGNSALTMNFRFPHQTADELLALIDPDDQTEEGTQTLRDAYRPYSAEAFLADLQQTSGGQSDVELTSALAKGAAPTIRWLRGLGHRWEYKPSILPGAVPIRLRNSGRALQEHAFAVAERLGVAFAYDCRLDRLRMDQNRVIGAVVVANGQSHDIDAGAVVLACGGYQADPTLRRQHLGAEWEHVALRGVPYNTGDGIRAATEIGAARAGDYTSCHATPQSANLAPHMRPGDNDASQANSRYAFNYGITVNRHGQRFINEGQDLPNFVYAKFGAAIVAQPDQIAFQIFDGRLAPLLPKSYFTARNMYRAETPTSLAKGLGIDPAGLLDTLTAFNAACPEGAVSDLRARDGRGTQSIAPAKSNWAAPLDLAPFYACPVRAGITFTYGGIRISPSAEVLNTKGQPIPNLFAAGEIVGGIFHGNYAGGSGMMSGAFFGRQAGQAALRALQRRHATVAP